ncbi:T6SS effector amidase Tae4 family protein [Helicobacter bilis]|uniref:T6SS effector amidase Tae4 family protein n=1 Tax=Helicobacter bilis TaxID=37372 RepID=UPI001F24A71B|nr:T6SS effector amidase Tae4 family protein [Helicobacter bilis]
MSKNPMESNLYKLSHIQTLQGGKMSAIQWGYYVKQKNENLKSKITIKDLQSFTFTSNDVYNTKVSFNLNAKFTYTITENNTQKEITDYLKDNQQLVIFAYKNNPAYNVGERITHTILTISQYPILKLTNKALTILYTHTNATYTLKHSCDTHYLSKNLKSEIVYTLEFRESSLSIKDTKSNKDIALMLTKEIPNIQEKTILLDSKDLQALQTTLGLYTHRDKVDVYVEVELSKWDRLKNFYLDIHSISQDDMEESRQRIGVKRLWEWVNSGLNCFGYGEILFIKAEIRYYKVKGAIYTEFMKSPYNYINTCAARMSKALVDSEIPIRKLQGMDSTAYIANAGTNTKPYKILVKVKDMIDFLKLNNSLGKPIIFTPNTNQTNQDFRYESLSKLDGSGIVAIKVKGWGDAWGHITLWDNREQKFLDDENYLTRGDYVEEVYFWKIED